MPIPMLIAAGVAAAGGLLGQVLGNASRSEAEAIMQRVRDEFGRIDPAKVRQVAVEVLGPTKLAELESGEEMSAMGDSLGRMGDGIKAGGMTLQDSAALNESLDEVAQQDRAQRAAATRDYAGTGSQGLLAKLVGQQGSSQRSHRAGTNAAASAQQRYWQMVQGRAGLADQMYGRKAQTAQAQDAIARWNATNRQDTQKYNNSLEADRWDRDYRAIAGKAGLEQRSAEHKRQDGDRTQEMVSRLGATVGKGVVGAFGDDNDEDEEYPRRNRGY